MKIYHNLIHIKDIPNFILHKDGAFLMRLVGVNFWRNNKGRTMVEPVHKPMLTYGKSAGQIWADFYLKEKILRVILQKRSPKIQIGKYPISMEDNND